MIRKTVKDDFLKAIDLLIEYSKLIDKLNCSLTDHDERNALEELCIVLQGAIERSHDEWANELRFIRDGVDVNAYWWCRRDLYEKENIQGNTIKQ